MLIHCLCSHSLHAPEGKREKKNQSLSFFTIHPHLAKDSVLTAVPLFPQTSLIHLLHKLWPKTCWLLPLSWTNWQSFVNNTLCKHSFQSMLFHVPRLNNTSGHTQTLCSFASYPKQFYTSWFNFKVTQVQQKHGPTSTGNWRTYKQLAYSQHIFCNIPLFKVKR